MTCVLIEEVILAVVNHLGIIKSNLTVDMGGAPMYEAAIGNFILNGNEDGRMIAANNLFQGMRNIEYIIKKIETQDSEMKDFLFTLGCYEGEGVTIISILADNYVVAVKDARYSIDTELAEVIKI